MQITSEWLGQDIGYEQGLTLQTQRQQEVLAGESPDFCYLLEHSPVYTIGRTRDKSSLLNPSLLPHPQVEISRGGQATYHGPGQLVGYPIIDLKKLGKDLHTYIRAIEQGLINCCADFGVEATTSDGLTGVWVKGRKIASIGVGVRKWISLHGFAINITAESLSGFQSITPCGIAGVQMTCLNQETENQITVKAFADAVGTHLESAFAELEI